MSRCYECDGCVTQWSINQPDWCKMECSRIFTLSEIINSRKNVNLFKELYIRIFGKKIIGYDKTEAYTCQIIMHLYKKIYYMITPIKYFNWNPIEQEQQK